MQSHTVHAKDTAMTCPNDYCEKGQYGKQSLHGCQHTHLTARTFRVQIPQPVEPFCAIFKLSGFLSQLS